MVRLFAPRPPPEAAGARRRVVSPPDEKRVSAGSYPGDLFGPPRSVFVCRASTTCALSEKASPVKLFFRLYLLLWRAPTQKIFRECEVVNCVLLSIGELLSGP